MKIIEIELPIVVVSEANRRDHWSKKHRRTANQRANIAVFCRQKITKLAVGEAATITLTRLATRKLDDDNLVGAFKAVRDEIAALLGVDDGSPRLTWLYKQEIGSKLGQNQYGDIKFEGKNGIRIKIEVYPSLESQAENAMEIFAEIRQRGGG